MKLRYFDGQEVAQLYAASRPYFHPTVINRIPELVGINVPVARGLDIGCGTGLSTVALRLIASEVLGTDISASMIESTLRAEGVSYAVADAENQPVEDASQDIVTISSAYHWVTSDRFFQEVLRVLKPNGLFVVYENGFHGEMEGNPSFAAWPRERHYERFPTPPRGPQLSPAESVPDGFEVVASEKYLNSVAFDLDLLVDYFLTQTNVIAKVESGETTYDEARVWLRAEMEPFFATGKSESFVFGGLIHVLRKSI